MQNSGNEAKKYLKTKENHFLNAANYARFARKLAQIRALKEQKQRILPKTNRRVEWEGSERQMTGRRLQTTGMEVWRARP